MEYERTVTLNAPVQNVWSLIDDLKAVAECIPGVSDFVEETPESFECVMTQKVGHVRTRLDLTNQLTDIEPMKRVTVVSDGKDTKLRASVRTEQTFQLAENGDHTDVAIKADIQVTGRIATFGGRIILAKTEQIVVKALANVEDLLRARGLSTTTNGTPA